MYTLDDDPAAASGGTILADRPQVEVGSVFRECRAPTLASRRQAVERVIRMMRERYPDPLS
ncbi:MAG TPA: hypothetical protein VFQ76_01340, partial [Longimicrobiaceae bacterium]|nr:hypothetical protein [Longimicrobiaceae bacterium]